MCNTRQKELEQKVELLEGLLAQAESVAREESERAGVLEMTPCLDSLNELQREIGEWGKQTFPKSSIKSITLHLQEEAEELRASLEDWKVMQMPKADSVIWPTIVTEWCDTALWMLHLAHRGKFSLFDCLKDRFQEIQTRGWDEGTERGYSKHIEEETQF